MWIAFSAKCHQFCCERHDSALVRGQASSERRWEPWYPWILQVNKHLQHLEVLLPAQLLIDTPLLEGESLCRAGREDGAYSSAAVIHGLVAQHKPTFSQSWGVVKSQRKIHQHSYPHLSCYHSCLLVSHPEVMWVSALQWCFMDVPFMGTQYITLLAEWPYAWQ